MRRAVPVLFACLLFGATACGTARNADPGFSRPPAPPAASVAAGANGGQAPASAGANGGAVLAQTKQVCEAIGQVYSDNMGRFAGSLSSLVADRSDAAKAKTSQERAQKALGTFGEEVRKATEYAPAAARTAGQKTADKLKDVSADDAFFAKIKTSADMDKVITTDLTAWLKPITQQCS